MFKGLFINLGDTLCSLGVHRYEADPSSVGHRKWSDARAVFLEDYYQAGFKKCTRDGCGAVLPVYRVKFATEDGFRPWRRMSPENQREIDSLPKVFKPQ